MIELSNGIRIVEKSDQIKDFREQVFNHNMGILVELIEKLSARVIALEQQIADLARRERDWP